MKDTQDRTALKELIARGEFLFSDSLGRKTESRVFDKRTIEAIYEVMKRNSIDYVDFPISSGKESLVFKAYRKRKPVVIKVFKTSTLKFSKLSDYIDGDHRFEKERKTRANLVMIWTRKEYANLLASSDAKVLAPKPIAFNKNILVMQYLGTQKSPAPQLRKVPNPEIYYDMVIENLFRLYREAGLVHADLSEFNILVYRKKPYFIDMGQSVATDHPSSDKFLRRDLYNISTFYARYGIRTDIERLYNALKTEKNDSGNS